MDKMLEENNIVDHVPDITDSTGSSPLMEEQSISSSGSSSLSGSFAGDEDENPSEVQQAPTKLDIAAKENAAIFRFKMLILGILCMCAIGVSVLVYTYLNGAENEDFDRIYESYATQMFDSVGTQLEQNLATMDSFALALVSHARFSNTTFPFVTLPDSATRMSKVRGQTNSSMIQILHLVSEDNRDEYQDYTMKNYGWANVTIEVQTEDKSLSVLGFNLSTDVQASSTFTYLGQAVPPGTGPYATTWQGYPLVESLPSFNVDVLRQPVLGPALETSVLNQMVVLSEAVETADSGAEPMASYFFPVLQDSESVATMSLAFYWRSYFEDVLQEGEQGLLVVVKNTCSQAFSYQIDGPKATFLGPSDMHDKAYNNLEISMTVASLLGSSYTGVPMDTEFCAYTIESYPTEEMEDDIKGIVPLLFLFATICIFVLTGVIFLVYDMLVSFRQKKVLKAAEESNAIVSQLFPENVRDRLFKKEKGKRDKKKAGYEPTKAKMRNFLSDGSTDGGDLDMMDHDELDDRPIADLFPETTILFADIAGFTAWSSVREPSQVFILLEKIYGAFDRIATRRGVFKVETIGDSYVAVCGLPEPRVDHAVVMVKFADQCRASFTEITRDLEFTLGPETGDLRMRFGLNSGPTTAGVLRGQKSRFQLFGDSVNTAARMESTGEANCIQVSQTTADLLITAKKEHWLEPRAEKIDVKGKGLMQTYFADPQRGNALSISMHSGSVESAMVELAHRNERMVYWCTDIMAKLLRQIVARREASYRTGGKYTTSGDSTIASMEQISLDSSMHKKFKKTGHVIEEVVEVIHLPEYDATIKEVPESEITLSPETMKQLREYVTAISGTYRENPFHNFEHASHVVMSVAKLLSRIVAPDSVFKADASSEKNINHALHDYTYGITSDPLTQFACVFAALIHDSDHYGIPNNQLVNEKAPLAHKYRNRSPAEQNSVNIAWRILMKNQFSALRATICPSEEEMLRFRQLVVNSVMATDIADKDMKTLRNNRWATAFADQTASVESERTNINRKATIVIEHLIQASDVAHTMQHWHVYTKWNERLFQEMSLAYLVGRAEKDPVEFWYKGELGFYDFYIIPLAKKLSECGVFGVSSDEYLNYAMRNREEWERRGEEILQGMVERFQVKLRDEYGDLGAGQASAGNSSSSLVETSIREE